MTTPPWWAGSSVTAAGLDDLIPQIQVLAADTPSTGTGAQAILTFTGLVAATYRLTGRINYEATSNAGTANISLHAAGSLAVSSMWVDVDHVGRGGGSANIYAGQLTALGGTFSSQTLISGDTFSFTLDGIINVSVAGSLTVDVAESNSGDGFTVRANSYARLELVL